MFVKITLVNAERVRTSKQERVTVESLDGAVPFYLDYCSVERTETPSGVKYKFKNGIIFHNKKRE